MLETGQVCVEWSGREVTALGPGWPGERSVKAEVTDSLVT